MKRDLQTASCEELLEYAHALETRLKEAEEALRALREGEVDAIVASGPHGDRVYTLKGADEAYRIMVEEMGEGAITLSSDGLILFSNERFAALLGRPLGSVIGARLSSFVAPEDANLIAALLDSAGRRKAEVRMMNSASVAVPVYVSLQNVLLSGMVSRCAIVTDLSEQKRYTELAAVLEAVPVGVFIAQDKECRNIVGNRMAYEMLRIPPATPGTAPGQALEKAKGWRGVKDGRDIPTDEIPMYVAARTGQPVYDYELDVLFDDGVYRSWLGNAVPLFNNAGLVCGAVGAVLDITDRRRTAEALQAANAELRDFGNALTQDLREPLSLVVKFTQLVAEEYRGKLSETGEEYLADSLEGALKVDALLKALLDYWTITERSGAKLVPVDCNRLLAGTLRSLKGAMRKSRATVTYGALPTIAGEELMLEQIFRTLIGNAIQYRGKADPNIHISAVNTFDRWLFSVRDNGIGIDPKNAEKVFKMFKRLHGSEIPGTGVGLALCKKVVELHGGRIWVEPNGDRGAAFRFTMPMTLDPTLRVS